jgi:hypothetical protein
MAIEIAAEPRAVTIHLRGWDWVFAARRRLEIPAEHIAGAAVVPRDEVHRPAVSLASQGSFLPGVLHYGPFGRGPNREFWAVRRQERLVVIDCRGWGYARVVLGVPEPEMVAGTVRLVTGGR